jgi:phenylalanyl-tRNA synthetase beta chain
LLARTGLQEIITYRLTTPAAEARILGQAPRSYITLANPTSPERSVMRQSLLNSVLEIVAENSKHRSRVQLFEIGQVYLPDEEQNGEKENLPLEERHLAIAIAGPREERSWLGGDLMPVGFFDLKGIIEALLAGLHCEQAVFVPATHPIYRPGRMAELKLGGQAVGHLGQLHPTVVAAYAMQFDREWPVLAAVLNLDLLLEHSSAGHTVRTVSRFPAVQQDVALVVDEATSSDRVEALLLEAGQPLLTDARLFDLYRGEQLGRGKKSLAYNLTYQAEDRTLTDKVVAKQQAKIVKRLERELGAKLRS